MTDWKSDFDALVQETMAFVKNNRVAPPMPGSIVEPPLPRTVVEPATPPAIGLGRLPPLSLPKSERDEIRQRVSNFKAHQERVAREREEFAASQLKRMLERTETINRKPMREKGVSCSFDDPSTFAASFDQPSGHVTSQPVGMVSGAEYSWKYSETVDLLGFCADATRLLEVISNRGRRRTPKNPPQAGHHLERVRSEASEGEPAPSR
jgi:hypothetical protein